MNIIDNNIYKNCEYIPEDTSGWNGNNDIFAKLIELVLPKLIIEVGSWKGQSAINMARHIKNNYYETKIICVDTWLGSLEFWTNLADTPERNLLLKNGYPQVYYQFINNVIHNNVQDIILPFPNTSYIAYQYFLSMNIMADLIYIDASHDEFSVYNDLTNYYQILNKDGIIFGDDYNNWPGVKLAVDKFINENNLYLKIEDENYWIIE
jgi:SAM-dependent methyltransferase